MHSPDTWLDWLTDFRDRFIVAKGWSGKEAKRCIRDAFAVVRDGRVHVLLGSDQRPVDAVPVFEILTPGGWKVPIKIRERLAGLVERAISSQRSPRDIVMGLLSCIDHVESPDESDEIKQKRDSAAFWVWQLRNACEDEALAGVIDSDVFWQVPLSAYQAGYRHAILDLYLNPKLFGDLTKAQAFQSGRGPDEVSRRLEANYLERRAVLGREPSARDVTRAAGGVWSEVDDCWEFDELTGLPSITHRGIRERLKEIRRKHRKHVK